MATVSPRSIVKETSFSAGKRTRRRRPPPRRRNSLRRLSASTAYTACSLLKRKGGTGREGAPGRPRGGAPLCQSRGNMPPATLAADYAGLNLRAAWLPRASWQPRRVRRAPHVCRWGSGPSAPPRSSARAASRSYRHRASTQARLVRRGLDELVDDEGTFARLRRELRLGGELAGVRVQIGRAHV